MADVNDKKVRGGKRSASVDWGTKHWLTKQEWGQKPGFSISKDGQRLGFKGSGVRSFLYFDPTTNTYRTVRAHNADEARQIAGSFGLQKVRKKR